MNEQGGVKLTLTNRPKDNDPVNGLAALYERLAASDDGQYVLMRVVPVETTRRRHDGKAIVKVEIRALEPLVDDADRRAAASLMEQATRLRLDRDKRTPDTPEDMLADLDARARSHRDDEPPDGSTMDAFLANEGLRNPAAGAYDDL